MSSLQRTIQRNGNPEYFTKRLGGGMKSHTRHPRAGKRRLITAKLLKNWQCACGEKITAGSPVLRFAGSQLCTICGYPKFKEMATIKGWKV